MVSAALPQVSRGQRKVLCRLGWAWIFGMGTLQQGLVPGGFVGHLVTQSSKVA